MQLVTIFDTEGDRFKVGANVHPADSEDIVINNFKVQVGDVRIETGVSTLSKSIDTGDYVRLLDRRELQIQTIDDSKRGKRRIFARGT